MGKNIYNNATIYKIVDNAYTEQYIGSTTVGLSARMVRHRASYWSYKRTDKGLCASFILFDKYGLENCKIELIEHYPCKDKEELRKREGHWIKLEDCINRNVAGRIFLEYKADNAEKLKQQYKEYYRTHSPQKQQYKRLYHIDNRERLNERSRTYHMLNADKIHERKKQYRNEHKEEIKQREKQYKSEKIECEHCNNIINRGSMLPHIRRKHPDAIIQ